MYNQNNHNVKRTTNLLKRKMQKLKNRICLGNQNFDKSFNSLKLANGKWLEREMILKQILRARKHSRIDLLEREIPQSFEKKLGVNPTCYPA